MCYCFFVSSFSSSFFRKCRRQRYISADNIENTYIAFASSIPNLTVRIIAIIMHINAMQIQRISIGCFRCFFIW